MKSSMEAGAPYPTKRLTRSVRILDRAVPFLLVACCLAPTAVPAADIAITAEQKYQLALEARTERDYALMMKLLREAAREGDLPAQELLGSMLVGAPLQAGVVKPSLCEALHWGRESAAQGSIVGQHHLLVLNQLRDAPRHGEKC